MGLLNRWFGRPAPQQASPDPRRQAHRDRQLLMAELWNYYRGRHHHQLMEPKDGSDDRVTINLCRKVVNQGVNFLFGKPVEFEIEETEEGERSDAEAYLDRAWADDPLRGFSQADFLQGVALNGEVCGQAFIRLYPGDESTKPELVNIDPALVDVVTDPDNKMEAREIYIVWQVKLPGNATGAPGAAGGDTLWKRDRFTRLDEESWEIAREHWTAGATPEGTSGWQLVQVDEGEEPNPVLWEYPFPPLFWCQNLKNTQDFWGISALEDADINDAINFNASNVNRILRFHAHPRTVGLGIQAGQIQQTAVDGFWSIPVGPGGASVQNLEMQSDLASSRQYISDLRNALYEVTDTPDLDPAKVQVGSLSGFALRLLYGPLLSKTESKRLRYGGMLARLNYAMLVTAGKEVDPEQPPRCIWQNPLPQNALEQAQLFGALASASGNVYAAAKAAGFDEDTAQSLAEAGWQPTEEVPR